jgi:hypothetical protein
MILSRMELSFIFFIFAAFIVIPGTFFGLALFNRYLAGGIAAMGMLVLFILFGIQFFGSDGNYIQQTVPTKWPPSINMCPDYLSLYKDTTNPSTPVLSCVDMVGVSPNQALRKYVPSNSATPAVVNVSPPATKNADGVITPQLTVGTSNGLNLYLNITDDTERREFIIADCRALGLTFEGIFDGSKTYSNVIPRIPTV